MPRGTLSPAALGGHYTRMSEADQAAFLREIGADRLADRNGQEIAAPQEAPVDPVRQQLGVCREIVGTLEDTAAMLADIRSRLADESPALSAAIGAIDAATLALARFALSRVPRSQP